MWSGLVLVLVLVRMLVLLSCDGREPAGIMLIFSIYIYISLYIYIYVHRDEDLGKLRGSWGGEAADLTGCICDF